MYVKQEFILVLYYLFLKDFIIFTERKGGRKRGKDQCVVASQARPLLGDLASNPGMCPDWELNC